MTVLVKLMDRHQHVNKYEHVNKMAAGGSINVSKAFCSSAFTCSQTKASIRLTNARKF